MKKHIYLLSFLFISFISNSQNKPKNIEEALDYFEKNWTKNELATFKKKPEKEATTELHMTVGMWIRNSWIRNGNDSLINQFHEIGVFHPDDISSIILTCLHRKLNNQKLKIKKQAEYYKNYWKPITKNNENSKKTTLKIYNKFKVGDIINIYYPVETQNKKSNAVIYENNSDWIFDAKKDLKITGIIKEKFFLGDKTNVFFKLEITKMNKEETTVLMEEMKIGETYDFHLDKLKID